jgi:hypothetical protein
MSHKLFEVKIDRVIVVGPKLDEKGAQRLRAFIEEAMREKMAAIREPLHGTEAAPIRIDLPGLSLETIEGARRIAYATAEAVMDALRGKTP